MKLDFLTPGNWEDSYESRVCNPFHLDRYGRDSYEINTLGDILSVARSFMQISQQYFELFSYTNIYIDGESFGELNNEGRLTVYAPCRVNPKTLTLHYPYGQEDKIFHIA